MTLTASEIENTEQVTRIFEAFGRGDVPFILEQLADDIRFTAHLDASVPWSGEYVGPDQVVSYFQALGGSVEVGAHPVDGVIAQGDTVVATGNVSFSVRGSGRDGASKWVYIWKLADGRVKSFDQFNDPGLAQAFA